MTFYWWSHWFWITLLDNIILCIVFVHSSPRQDSPPIISNNSEDKTTSAIKLYAANQTLIWSATSPFTREKLNNTASPADQKQGSILEEAKETEASKKSGKYEASSVSHIQSNLSKDIEVVDLEGLTDETNFNITQASSTISAVSRRDQVGKNQLRSGLEERVRRVIDWNLELKEEPPMMQAKMSIILTKQNATPDTVSLAKSRNEAITFKPLSELEAKNNTRPAEFMTSRKETIPYAQQEDEIGTSLPGPKSAFTLENVNKEDEILRAENEHRSRKSKVLFAEYNHVNRLRNFSSELKNMLTRSATTPDDKYDIADDNISSEALAIKRTAYFLDIRTISVICFTVFGVGCIVTILGVILYRRRFVNKPQALSEPDSSVYIDDSTIRDNSDEMYSLDNDSFLNSLEAMTIQNYWTDTVKHTKL